MAKLPSALKPVVDGYSSDDPGGVMRTEVSGGFSRYGMVYDRGSQRFNITFILDSLQFSIWNLFYLHVIKKGSQPFDMPMDSGFGIQDHTVQIMPGSYSASRTSGVMTSVNFLVETENKGYEVSTADAVNAIELYELLGAQMTPLTDQISIFANIDTLVLNEV